MALYLGNQKVSLRSGQDPTFDYGFDSNGRLVFANKNATEINNFLNYDSSYSEILDLSNLSKMEKVAVNGTVDRKMEGLKGLLVSPNAPFTGSSPQINASYTGMNKSALVSLFESVPYNVGYEVVGNPTIVDGVVSGITDKQNFITVNASGISTTSTCEFIILLRNTTTIAAVFNISENENIRVMLNNENPGGIKIIDRTGAVFVDVPKTSFVWINKEKLYIKITRGALTNNVYNYTLSVSYDKLNWVSATGTSSDNLFGSIIRFGCSKNSYGTGYAVRYKLDLNETHIKVNGVPCFTGKPAMTKTCSIVGATGTADLTQEDKNIILNKGWSLTVQ